MTSSLAHLRGGTRNRASPADTYKSGVAAKHTGASLRWENEITHRPLTEIPGLDPQVVATHPVQILGRPDFVADQPSTSLGVLIEGDAVFHKAPSSVYDLRPSLGLQGLFATRDPVAGHLDI